MNKSIFMDKYPINSLEIKKNHTTFQNTQEILGYLKTKIDAHEIATFISLFDHYTHTKKLNGEINPEIIDAQNIIFCFGAALPNTQMLAVRPRSIGVAELENSFVIEFIDAPNEKLQNVMEAWITTIQNK